MLILKFIFALLLLSFTQLSYSHDPINFNTQDVYLIANVLNPKYEGGDMYEVFELMPGIGIGTALTGIKLGYGQVFVEAGYNYLGTYHRDVYEGGTETNYYLYDNEETLQNIYANLKLSYPLSDNFLMNLKLGRGLFYTQVEATSRYERSKSYDIKEGSDFSNKSMVGFGFEYLLNDKFSYSFEYIEYGYYLRTWVGSFSFRL